MSAAFANFAGETVYINARRFWGMYLGCGVMSWKATWDACGARRESMRPASLDSIGLVALLATTFEGDEETGHPDDDGDVPTHFDPLPLHPVNHAKHHGSDSHNSAK